MTPAEDEALRAQLALAVEHELPVLVHTPHRDKAAGTRKTLELVEESGIAPETVADRPQQRADRQRGRWRRAAGRASRSTRTRRWTSTGWCAILEEHGPERILVNSACDWGVSRPAEGRARPPTRCRRRASTTTTIDRVVWRNPVEFFAQSGRLILDDLGERGPDGDVRGQRRAARRAGVRLRHPDGSLLHLAYCSNVHPADDLDGVAAQLERYAARVRERLDVPVLGVGLWVAAPALADAAAADRLARAAATGSALEVVTLNGFPYKAFHAPVVKRDVYRPDWAGPAAARLHARARAAARRAAARRRRRGLDLDAAARLARRAGTTPPQDAGAARAGGRRRPSSRRCEARDRQADPARAGARARLHGRDDRAGRATSLAGLAPEWIGVCLDACHLAVQFEDAGRRGRARCADAGVPVVKAQVSSALRVADAGVRRRARAARALRRAALPAPGARARRTAHVDGADDLPEALAGAPARRGASGACTSTCRSTRPSTRRRTSSSATLRRARGRRRAADPPPRGGDLHLERPAPTRRGDDDGLVAGLAGELAWTRDRLVALGAEVVGMTLVVDRRRRADPARAAAHAAAVEARRRRLPGARWTRSLPAVTCSVQSTFAHRPDADRPRHRRQRLVLPRPRRGLPLAPAQRARAGREGLGDRAPRASPASAPRTSAGGTRWARRPTSPSRRGRSTTPTAASRPTATRTRPQLHDDLTGALGDVPAVPLLGADGRASRRREWIADAAEASLRDTSRSTCCWSTCRTSTTTSSASAPTRREAAAAAARARRRRSATLLDARARARRHGRRAVASTASPTRAPAGRRSTARCAARGCCDVYTQAGMEYLDPWTSRAFAVADHQIAHVYVRDPADVARGARGCSPALRRRRPRCSTATARRRAGLDHERAGELVARRRAATPGSPTTTGSTTPARPTSRRQVEIHRKPGYDPAELFLDPDDQLRQGCAPALALARKKLGHALRDERRRRSTRRRCAGTPRAAARRRRATRPVLLCSDASVARDRIAADRRARPAARARRGPRAGGVLGRHRRPRPLSRPAGAHAGAHGSAWSQPGAP